VTRWIPDPTDLGPDPEPFGERFEVLLAAQQPAAGHERAQATERLAPVPTAVSPGAYVYDSDEARAELALV
jgi:hypothetical protein